MTGTDMRVSGKMARSMVKVRKATLIE